MKLNYRNPKNAQAVAAYWGKSLDKPDWYEFKALSGDTAEVFIFDVIGWPFTDISGLVRSMAAEKDKPILARINSPGGDVFDGMSLYNAFANHPGGVTVRIEGLAASIASIVAMGGRKVEAYQNTTFMIHNAWGVVAGNKQELTDIADILGKIDGNMRDIYTGKTKMGKREITQMMDDETYMTAQEAKDKGFVDTILTSGKGVKAQFEIPFANVPDGLFEDPEGRELTRKETERALRKAGASREYARAVAAKRADASDDEAEQRLIDELNKSAIESKMIAQMKRR